MKHKPSCSTNIHCLVYHENGICNMVRKCDCGTDFISSQIKQAEERSRFNTLNEIFHEIQVKLPKDIKDIISSIKEE